MYISLTFMLNTKTVTDRPCEFCMIKEPLDCACSVHLVFQVNILGSQVNFWSCLGPCSVNMPHGTTIITVKFDGWILTVHSY